MKITLDLFNERWQIYTKSDKKKTDAMNKKQEGAASTANKAQTQYSRVL